MAQTSCSVIIVGAGIAGISCAHYLMKNGVNDVTILEADNRWGGRVKTTEFGDSLVELGANWIHGGALCNPVFQLANREPNLLVHEGRINRLNRKTGFFYQPGGKCVDRELGEKAYDAFTQFKLELEQFYGDQKATNTDTMSFFEKKLDSMVQAFPPPERCEAEAILWGLVNYLQFHIGDNLDLCNARLYGSYWDMPGGDVIIPGGYQNVFKHLHDIVEKAIYYGKEVNKIDYDKDEIQTVVICKDGSKFNADHVVVTVPLGYLKKHHMCMFNPPLPPAKQEAIENIAFGRTGKIFLEFEEPFWAKDEGVIKIAWGKEAIINAKMPEEWFKYIMGFEEVINNRRVLVAWISSRGAEVVEKLSNEEVNSTLTKLLRSCTGNECLPRPIRILKTGWISNSFTLGSYSYGGMASDIPRNQNQLAEPMLKKYRSVRFAGEATHPFAYSTVHGAYLTGVREAKGILQS